MFQYVMILLIGSFAGIMTGLLGASGVMAVVPGMLLLGYSAPQAIGTSLAVDLTASLAVSWTYHRHGRVNLRQGLWIAAAAVLGAQVGSHLSSRVPEIGLSAGFGVVLLGSAVIFWRNGIHREIGKIQATSLARLIKRRPAAACLIIGLYAGIYSGLFGAGGGMLFLFALLLLGYSLHHAIGTSTLIMALTTASGTLGHAMLGNLPYLTVAGIAGGTVLGSISSARLANRMDERFLGKAIALVLGFLSIAVFAAALH